MKSIIKYIIVAMFIFPSCDYLDVVPDNTPTLDNAFTDRFMAERFLATCYSGLPTPIGFNTAPGSAGAFELVLPSAMQTQASMVIALGKNDRTTAQLDIWATGRNGESMYATLRNCNTFFDNIEKVPDLSREEKDRWIAEVKLIKAYCHFVLITYYGPMCIVRESAPVTESTQGVRVYRNKVDDCFAYVVELLDEVIDSDALPKIVPVPISEQSRFTRAAAYAIKAKVLVYWASPLFNGNTELATFVDHNNEPFFNQTPDPSRWDKAVAACKAAITACGESSIRLYQQSDYTTLLPVSDSTARVNMLREAITKKWNVELIWASYYSDGAHQSDFLPRLETQTTDYSVTSAVGSVPFSTVELFYSKNGVPFNEDAAYTSDYATRFDRRSGDYDHRYYIEQGQETAVMNFNREPRFYSTLGFDRGKWYGNSYASPPSGQTDLNSKAPHGRYNEYSSAWGTDLARINATGYWPKKLVAMNTSFTSANLVRYDMYPFPNMRYADLLLLTAEAVNEAQATPDNEVWKYIDEVRVRAGLDGVVNSWQNHASTAYKNRPADKGEMRKIIQQERKIELACEGHYFWDSRRWKTAVNDNNRLIQGWNVQGVSASDYYIPTTLYIQKFTTPRDYFFPIPESDFINNPQLIQNRGW